MKKNLFKNLGITLLCLAVSTAFSFFFFHLGNKHSVNTALLYILALIIISLNTDGYIYGIAASFFCVAAVNIFFTYPFFRVNVSLDGYAVTFVGMLAITTITCTTTTMLKQQKIALDEREKKLAEVEKEKIRANLLRAVSHDFRTPLTCIIGSSASYIEDYEDLTEPERLELLTNINEDANWLLDIVENLLTVTRIHNNCGKVKKSPEVVEEVVSEAIARARKRCPELKLSVNMPAAPLTIPMDAILIEQVLINILENACMHSNSRRPVELIIKNYEDKVSFTIRDYGIGIDESQLPFIFTGIYDDNRADRRRGMGIGLSICHTIITAHSGTISSANHEDGAEFTFILFKEKVDECYV